MSVPKSGQKSSSNPNTAEFSSMTQQFSFFISPKSETSKIQCNPERDEIVCAWRDLYNVVVVLFTNALWQVLLENCWELLCRWHCWELFVMMFLLGTFVAATLFEAFRRWQCICGSLCGVLLGTFCQWFFRTLHSPSNMEVLTTIWATNLKPKTFFRELKYLVWIGVYYKTFYISN